MFTSLLIYLYIYPSIKINHLDIQAMALSTVISNGCSLSGFKESFIGWNFVLLYSAVVNNTSFWGINYCYSIGSPYDTFAWLYLSEQRPWLTGSCLPFHSQYHLWLYFPLGFHFGRDNFFVLSFFMVNEYPGKVYMSAKFWNSVTWRQNQRVLFREGH